MYISWCAQRTLFVQQWRSGRGLLSTPTCLLGPLCPRGSRDTQSSRQSASAAFSAASVEELELNRKEEEQVTSASPPTHTKVKTADYVSSSVKLSQCPAPKWPEFAVIGRSNVGKSSLINMLTGRNSLALVSKSPGKTKCINHFLINNSWYLVDLPGYGYATTAKVKRLEWFAFTKEYFLHRDTLAMVLLLVDASVTVQAADLECATWLADSQVPFCLVFTKMDKRKKRCPSPAENIAAFQEALLQTYEQLPVCLTTSSEKDLGRQDVLNHIARMRSSYTDS